MKDKINNIEFSITMFMLAISPFLGMGIYNLLKIAKINSPITIIVSYLLTLCLMPLFLKIYNYKTELNLKEKIYTLFSKKTAYIFCLIISICFLIMASCLSYNLNSFMISQFLDETPIIIMAIIFGILITYINSKGIYSITRLATLFFVINFILIGIAITGDYINVDISNIKPLFNGDYNSIFKGAIYTTLLNVTYIFLMLIIPKKSMNNDNKTIFLWISLVFILFLIVIIHTISVLGIDLALLYHYPGYIILKEINLFGFIDKIENFIIIHWIFEVFITLSLTTYFINKMTNIKPYIITFIMIFLYLLIFKNSTFFNYFVTEYIPFIASIILMIIIIIAIRINKKTA